MIWRYVDWAGRVIWLRDPECVEVNDYSWGDCVRAAYRYEGENVWYESGDFRIDTALSIEQWQDELVAA